MADEPPSLRERWLPITCSAAGSVAGGTIGSLLGVAGSTVGFALGALVSGIVATLTEHAARKARERAAAIRKAHLQGVVRDAKVWDELFGQRRGRDIPWRAIAVTASCALVLALGAVTVVSVLAGRSPAATARSGFSPTGYQPAPQPASSPSPSPSPSPSASPSPSPSLTPSPSPSAFTISPSPSASASASPSLSASPSASPSPSP